MSKVLLIDFGSTYTKVVAVDLEKEEILGTANGWTTVDTNIMDGLQQALTQLFDKTGKLEFQRVLGCSSAAGGLKMIAIGLVPELTAEAAKRAALGAGAKVLGVYCHELSEYEINEIQELKPDIILLAGGTNGGNKSVILHNAKMLTELKSNVPIVVAGNKSVAPEIVKTLSVNKSHVYHTENVMPKLNDLNIDPARAVIREIFLKRITEAKGLNKANEFVDKLVMPTPAAVLKAVELLGAGSSNERGMGDLIAVDIGGATTDIYSVGKGEPTRGGVAWRGLKEPFAKRTVEGDLGMRYSAAALLKAAGAHSIAEYLQELSPNKAEIEQEIIDYTAKVAQETDYIPQTQKEIQFEIAMAKACTKIGLDRHAGYLETYYAPQGEALMQFGKDLTSVPAVIGTGGVVIRSQAPEKILEGAFFETANPMVLKPVQPAIYIDELYIIASMGLLAEEYPDAALRIMKKYVVRRS